MLEQKNYYNQMSIVEGFGLLKKKTRGSTKECLYKTKVIYQGQVLIIKGFGLYFKK
jgi:hypothetical protein